MVLGLVRAGAKVALFDVNHTWLEQSAKEMREIAYRVLGQALK